MPEVRDEFFENEGIESVDELMARAARARATGDKLLGLHLFLAAYGQSLDTEKKPSVRGISALKEAWALALQLKERSLAEYIFERLEPQLTPDEAKACAESLQNLALDKLEQFGISRKDLEDVSEMIAQELHNGPAGQHGAVKSVTIEATATAKPGEDGVDKKIVLAKFPATQAPEMEFRPDTMRYEDLAGYANAIRQAKALGIGEAKDPGYNTLIQELNAGHGLSEPPALDPIIIVSPAREDAARFAFATAGELDLPVFRMYVEDNPQGLQALCLASLPDNSFTYDRKNGQFTGKGIVFLEDVDLWEVPEFPAMPEEGMNPFIMAQISKSVREVYNFLRTAVEDPNVTVLATAENPRNIVPFFAMLLHPYRTVEIDMPSAGERASIWMQLVANHPSLSSMNVPTLVKNSAHMARYDIYMAVADALEEAYRSDLNRGGYHPVKASRLYEKLAAFQPLDSDEYKTLEDAIVSDFRHELANLDDLLDS